MRLRTRILLGYWYLVALVVLSAGGAAIGFQKLGNNIGRVLDENFESVRASMAMVEALERQDSAVLAVLLGQVGARDQVEGSQANFSRALEQARANITLAVEVPVIEDIGNRFAAFVEARDQLLDAAPEQPLRAYEQETFPRFEKVKERVLDLLEVNHMAMVEADRRAQSAANRRASTLALIVLVALISLALLSRAMKRVVLDRLAELAEIAEAVAAGSTDRRAADGQADELGLVSRQLNTVLDRQQAMSVAIEGRVALFRELVLGLLGAFPMPAAVLSFDGHVLASTLPPGAEARLAAAADRLPPAREVEARPDRTLELDLDDLRVRLMEGSKGRPVAWLVTSVVA